MPHRALLSLSLSVHTFLWMKIGDEVAVGISKPLDELKQRLRTFAQGDS